MKEGGAVRQDLRKRTTNFALRIIRLYVALPKATEAQVIGKQFLRSGTSVGANYREAFRSRSDAEFISKLQLTIQELEETDYWIDLLEQAGVVASRRLAELRSEICELIAIFVSTVKSVKKRR